MRGAKTESAHPLRGAVNVADVKSSGWNTAKSDPNNIFSESEVLGNAFVFLLAGHETVANTLQNSLILLAMHPSTQRELQQSLDEMFGNRPVSEWDYDKDLPRLSNSMTGAVVNEELRLIPPVVKIPKCTKTEPQPLTLRGSRRIIVPGNTMITLGCVAVHRHPLYWSRLDASDPNDLEKFKPQRWFNRKDGDNSGVRADTPVDFEDSGDQWAQGDARSESAKPSVGSTLFNPPRGAFIPFSDGPRSCIGRRFAQVEALVVIAVIFRFYSVELDLAVVDPSLGDDATAYDGNLRSRSSGEKARLWNAARNRTLDMFRTKMMTAVTLQMRNGMVPLFLPFSSILHLIGDQLARLLDPVYWTKEQILLTGLI